MRYKPFVLISVLVSGLGFITANLLPAAASSHAVQPDAGMVAAVDAATSTLSAGTTEGTLDQFYGNLYATYGWKRTVTEISRDGLVRVDYSVFPGKRTRAGKPNLSILLFRPALPSRILPAIDAYWDRHLEFQREKIRGTSPFAGEAQKALWTVEQALNAAQLFTANAPRYRFSGTNVELSFVAQLPESFPGVKETGGVLARHVSVFLEQHPRDKLALVLEHTPLLLDGHVEPFRLVLARDVFLFVVDYADTRRLAWTDSWTSTNDMPRQVSLSLALLPTGEMASRLVTLPGTAVPALLQGVIPSRPPPTNSFRPQHRALEKSKSPEQQGPVKPTRAEPHELELEWLGRSGVELARYILAYPESSEFDSLNQKWAGGVGTSNSPVANIPMQNFPLGGGAISLRIIDFERKFNINLALVAPEILWTALTLGGATPPEATSILESIQDWQDTDDISRANGAESDYYLTLTPPCTAKNGPIDALSELLRVKGVTPRLFFGTNSGHAWSGGLRDHFASVSTPRVNINTATAETLLLVPELDGAMAQTIIQLRAGPDGIEGNNDDLPFRSVGEVVHIPGMTQSLSSTLTRHFTTRSAVFEVTVDARLGSKTRQYVAWLWRSGLQNVTTLKLYRAQ